MNESIRGLTTAEIIALNQSAQVNPGQTAANTIAGYNYPQGTQPSPYGQVRKSPTVGDLKKQLDNVGDDWTVSVSQIGYNGLTLSPPVQDSVKISL